MIYILISFAEIKTLLCSVFHLKSDTFCCLFSFVSSSWEKRASGNNKVKRQQQCRSAGMEKLSFPFNCCAARFSVPSETFNQTDLISFSRFRVSRDISSAFGLQKLLVAHNYKFLRQCTREINQAQVVSKSFDEFSNIGSSLLGTVFPSGKSHEPVSIEIASNVERNGWI